MRLLVTDKKGLHIFDPVSQVDTTSAGDYIYFSPLVKYPAYISVSVDPEANSDRFKVTN